jgi:multidrug efflux system membrane fusion protein
MHRFRAWIFSWPLLTALGMTTGCRHPLPQLPETPEPTVTISQPLERQVVDFVDFTGRTDAPFSTDIRARVTGYLVKMPFKEGGEVKAGDLLFEIDPRPYQAKLDQAKGQLDLDKAQLRLAKDDYARAQSVFKMNPGAISQQELDKYAASEQKATAAVEASKANVEAAQINLDFCKVTSPIDGKVSRYYFTLGNLVNQDQTLLTTVVSEDPMYAYFDIDERTMLRIVRALQAAEIDLFRAGKIPVFMGLADEEGFPHKGYLDFANNKVDPLTGTITTRGVFPNPATSFGLRVLRPGMFVRIRLPIDKPHKALLVAEQALNADQGQKYLMIVDDKKMVQYRRVKVGALQDDGLRVIETGLKPGEWVIVSGVQLVRPQMVVKTEEAPMPVNQGTPVPQGKDAKAERDAASTPAAKQ